MQRPEQQRKTAGSKVAGRNWALGRNLERRKKGSWDIIQIRSSIIVNVLETCLLVQVLPML